MKFELLTYIPFWWTYLTTEEEKTVSEFKSDISHTFIIIEEDNWSALEYNFIMKCVSKDDPGHLTNTAGKKNHNVTT